MDTRNLFKYEGKLLDASQREIRSLYLHPFSTDRITATLSVKDLASAVGTFACVSNSWGDPKKTVPIEVDDQEVQITTNLFDFLCHIRDPNETLTLWADSTCISQADLNEKSQQVAMMRDIYSGCSDMRLASPGVRAGDEVCALMGMRVPVVLRKADEEHDDRNAYHFVGDCFLLDHMDGEIMRNEEETKSVVLI